MQSFFCPTRIEMGAGVHAGAGRTLRSLGASRVVLVVDDALVGREVHSGIVASLDAEGIEMRTFTGIKPDPHDTTVDSAYALAREFDARALLALGGGSTIDVAKAVGILMTNGGKPADYEGIRKFSTPPLPLVAIPTSAGTGSEVSGSCVITEAATGRKMSLRHAEFNPATVAFLDPLAVSTLPASVAMHAGIDAFVHAFESYIARDANPVTDALNLHALELINANLLPFIADRSDEDAAQNMLCGSALAGMAFGITGLGNVHCIARFIGASFKLSHGLSNALCLPEVAAFNRDAAEEKYARLARLFGCDVSGATTAQAADMAVEHIRDLCARAGVPPRMRDAGVTNDGFEQIAADCAGAGYNKWNPRFTSQAEFLDILHRAY